jgi:amino acid adenylation domain-containing protein
MSGILEQRIAALSRQQLELLVKQTLTAENESHQDIVPHPDPSGSFPLSFAQQRLWFLDQLEPGNAFYNVPAAFLLEGRLDVEALHRSLNEIVRRHEVLRAKILLDSGTPRMAVDSGLHLDLPVIDLRPDPEQERRIRSRELADEEVRRPFDLTQGPLVRAKLLRLAEREHIFVLTMHHIVSDGWSIGIFARELAALYRAFSRGLPSPLPELAIQYSDFVRWQRHWLADSVLATQLGYWKRHLDGAASVLHLPADRRRPAIQSYRGTHYRTKFNEALTGSLEALCNREGATLFMALLAAFKAVIFRYTRQTSICVGCPIANRNRAETEALIGFFVNTLPISTDLSGNPTFRELLARVRREAVGAFDHQDVPFEKLVEELRPERRLSQTPLFQVSFVLQNAPMPPFDLSDLTLTLLDTDCGTSKFDLTLQVIRAKDGLELDVEYSTDLFEAETIVRMVGHLEVLLGAVVNDAGLAIEDLPLLGQAELRALRGWNATQVSYRGSMIVHRRFELQADLTPDSIAVEFEGRQVTYRELDRRGNQLAHRLRRLGVGPDVLVGIHAERSLAMIVGVIGIMKAGGGYVPLDPTYPPDRLAFMVDDAGIPIIVTEGRLSGSLPPSAAVHVCLDRDGTGFEAESAQRPLVEIDPDNLAYMIYTSGSTGRPKGALNAHRGICNRLLWTQDAYPLTDGDRVLHKTPLGFDVSAWEIFWPLITGARIIIARHDGHRDSAYLVDLIVRRRATIAHFVPSMLRAFLNEAGVERCGCLRTVICSGEALGVELRDRFFERLPSARLHNLYGPTECAIEVTAWDCAVRGQGPTVPIGHPIANVRMHVLDGAMQPVPIGVPGEVYVAGTAVGRGYHRRADTTAERFVLDPFAEAPGDRLYRTGDLARRNVDGALEFLGRIDHQVKVRGFRVEPGEVESVLAQHPDVREAAVVACGLASEDVRLVAYYVASGHALPPAADLRTYLMRSLPDYMLPAAFVQLKALPLLPNGKLDRGSLPEPDGTRGNILRPYVAPRTTLEQRLCALWVQLLALDDVGVCDDFFELGGHSLLGLQLVARVREIFHLEIPLRQVFLARTVAEFAALIGRAQSDSNKDAAPFDAGPLALAAPTIVPDPQYRHDPFPLNDVQQAYWIGRRDEFELGNVASHLYLEIDATDLDMATLEAALARLIDRHDMLRAVVLADGMQQILKIVPPLTVAYVDLEGRPPEAADIILEQIRDEMSHHVLAADRWPLFEVRATRIDRNRLRLHLSLDSLIGDALSWLIFLKELGQLVRRPESDLPALALSFRDYVLAEARLRETKAYQRASDYWTARLPTLPPAPDLPLLKPHFTFARPRFTRREGAIERDQWSRLKRRAGQAGVTPSGVLLAAFADILTVWSRSSHFTINLTLFNRMPMHPEVNAIIGDFTSLTLLEVDGSFPGSFEERAQRLQTQLWDDLDHREFSAVNVLRELARVQGHPFKASMPVVFSSTIAQAGGYDTSVIAELGELAYVITQTPQLYLDHQVYEEDGRLRFNWDAVEEIFPPGLLDEMFDAFRHHLHRLAVEEAAWSEVRLPSAPWLQIEQRAKCNAVDTALPSGLLHTAIESRAVAHPHRTAVVHANGSLSYSELLAASTHVGHWLRRRGARPGMLVAVIIEKSWEQVVAVLAVLQSGAAYLPIEPNVPAERLWFLLKDGQVRLVLTQAALDKRLDWPCGIERCQVDLEAVHSDLKLDVLAPVQSEEDLAYVMYTSGSTGVPKGVAINHRAALNTIADINRRFAVGPDDRILALSSLAFDLSVYDFFGTLGAGGTIVIPDPARLRDTAHWIDVAARTNVTVWNSVPALMSLAVEYASGRSVSLPASLRLVLLSGDWIPVGLPTEIRRLAPAARVVSLGGATEASIWSILYPIGDVDPSWHSIPYGWPMANQQVHVLDRSLEHRPVWVTGNIYIGGAGLARGYWRDDERTADAFVNHPRTGERLYRTGDLGRYLPDGSIEFLGREDFQVKIGGHRIELGEIEAILKRHPAVHAAVAVAREDVPDNKNLTAYVVPAAGQVPHSCELRDFLTERLPAYMVPTAVMILGALPLTANGKLDVKALPRPTPAPVDVSPLPTAVTNKVAKITSLVAGLIHKPELEPDTNLLELGVNSIDVVRIGNLLERELGFRIKFEEFYHTPSVAALLSRHGLGAFGWKSGGEPRSPAGPLGSESIPTFEMLLDRGKRHELKERRVWLRRDNGTLTIALPSTSAAEALGGTPAERKRRERFTTGRIGLDSLSELLSVLAHVATDGPGRPAYHSFGECFPIQVYLHVKPARVDGLDSGIYYHDPVQHRLVLLSSDPVITKGVHAPVYQTLFEDAAFSLFLIAQLDAIGPMYGGQAHRLCLLEAGHISQALMQATASCGIGLCPVGAMNFEPIRRYFTLTDSQILVHSLLGGPSDGASSLAAHEFDAANWEEGEL